MPSGDYKEVLSRPWGGHQHPIGMVIAMSSQGRMTRRMEEAHG